MLFHLDKNPPNGLQPQPARRSTTRVSLSLSLLSIYSLAAAFCSLSSLLSLHPFGHVQLTDAQILFYFLPLFNISFSFYCLIFDRFKLSDEWIDPIPTLSFALWT